MPYKIVQTVEKGKKTLVVIPSLWENEGKLWWPPRNIQFKVMKDEQSKPGNDWKLMKGTLKRSNILTYQQADSELSFMEENSDTDVNDNDTTIQLRETSQNFDVLAENLARNHENQGNPSTNYSIATEPANVANTKNLPYVANTENLPYVEVIGTESFDQILANQKTMSEKIDNLLQIQTITLENQLKMTQELAKQSVLIEEINLQLAQIKGAGTNVTLLKNADPTANESFTLKPVENQRELILLDQKLLDKAEKHKLETHLKHMCLFSEGGGKSCAYKLVERIFTRDFLCLCSWAGGSRGEMSKIALKDYKNVLKFFCDMIRTWDPKYTIEDNKIFFKLVTKNAMQRKSMKNLRTSSKRQRKAKNQNKRQKTGNENPANDDQTSEPRIQSQEQAFEKENIPLNNDGQIAEPRIQSQEQAKKSSDDSDFDGLC